MKKVKKWQYICDHCGKKGGSGGHMKKHEERCTINPGRKCGMCEFSDHQQKSISELVTFFSQFFDFHHYEWADELTAEFKGFDYLDRGSDEHDEAEKEALDKLREFVDGCPACMLIAMRFTNSAHLFHTFDWKKERDSFYSEQMPVYDHDYY